MYKACGDGIIRRCVPEEETNSIISHCHDLPYRGHASIDKSVAKILQVIFYWSKLFKDVHKHVWACDRCQWTGNLSRCNRMPLNYILDVEIFHVWGIDFMGPLPSPRGNKYILVYISKWVDAIVSPTNDFRVVFASSRT